MSVNFYLVDHGSMIWMPNMREKRMSICWRKMGVKFTLLSLRTGSHPKVSKVGRQTFFTITHSEQEMGAAIKESRVVHAIVVK